MKWRWLIGVMLMMLTACADDPAPPPPPSPPPVPVVCCSGILTWDNNTETDLAGYRVYRSEAPSIPNPPPMAAIAEVTTNLFLDVTGIQGATYYYVVTAFDLSGNESGVSNEVSKLY